MHRRSEDSRPHLPPPIGSSWIAVVRWRPVRRACRTGAVSLAVGLVEGHGAGVNGSLAGMPGCRRARGPGSGMAGLPAGCLRAAGDRGRGRRTPARDHRVGRVQAGGRAPVNVAVEPAGGVPGSPGCGRRRLPGASSPVVPSRRVIREVRRTCTLPPICAVSGDKTLIG
jgi:hypothetical protein